MVGRELVQAFEGERKKERKKGRGLRWCASLSFGDLGEDRDVGPKHVCSRSVVRVVWIRSYIDVDPVPGIFYLGYLPI